MRGWMAMGAAALCFALAGCAGYHQEVAALRMARPAGDRALAAYAAPEPRYPSVGGDILRGTSPTAPEAAYEATSGDNAPPAPPR